MKCHDDEILYFKPWQYVKKDSELHPGQEIVCCQDKECIDVPVDRKQTFIFCPTCSKDTYNFTICQQHASDYIDDDAMIKEEEKTDQQKKEKWDQDLKEKLKTMLLFLVIDVSDDGFIQKEEWMELHNRIV